jgi:hypothetical protein
MAAISRFNRRMLRVWVMAIGLWAGLGGLFPAGAHPILQTLVEVRVRPDRLRLHLVMPSSELVFALIEEGRSARPPPGFRRYPDAPAGLVRDYVQGHISARGADGQIYQVSLLRLTGPDTRLADGDPAKDWLADIELKPASGAVSGPVVMTYGVITKEVVNHDAIVSLEEDWQGGVLPGHGRIIGRVARGEQSVTISPGAGGGWRSLVGIVGMGLWHIAEGADHQAFLLMILLTAGLTVKHRDPVADGGHVLAGERLYTGPFPFALGHIAGLASARRTGHRSVDRHFGRGFGYSRAGPALSGAGKLDGGGLWADTWHGLCQCHSRTGLADGQHDCRHGGV